MSISNNRKKRGGQEGQAPSKVLLACVYDTIVFEITNELIYTFFSPFGIINHILIFEKGEVTKFFIEFYYLSCAIQAKLGLDGTKLFDTIGKMNIYFSNFSSVDLKHQTSQGIAINQQYHLSSTFSGRQNLKLPVFNSCLLFPFGDDQTERIEENNALQEIKIEQENSELEQTIQHDINSLLQSAKKSGKQNVEQSGRYDEKKRGSFPKEASRFIRYLVEQYVQNQKIYNLFSNFGNLSYIKQTRKQVFIKFKSGEFAEIARRYLEGHLFMGNKLQLLVVEDEDLAMPVEEEFSQITYYDSSFDRFSQLRSIAINPPANTLHISSIPRERANSESLRLIFERFGKIEKIEVLSQQSMALVRFVSLTSSFHALAEMHNHRINGRKIQISFTKSKI